MKHTTLLHDLAAAKQDFLGGLDVVYLPDGTAVTSELARTMAENDVTSPQILAWLMSAMEDPAGWAGSKSFEDYSSQQLRKEVVECAQMAREEPEATQQLMKSFGIA